MKFEPRAGAASLLCNKVDVPPVQPDGMGEGASPCEEEKAREQGVEGKA